MNNKWNFEMDDKTLNIYRNLSNQIDKVFSHTRQGRPIYEVVFNGQKQRVSITVGNNGFIVGANPSSIK